MEHGPSAQDGIELLYHPFLRFRPTLCHNVPDLVQKRLDIFPRRSDDQLVAVLPDILAEKVKALRDWHDAGLLFREFQTPFPQEKLNGGADFMFEDLFRGPGDNKLDRHRGQLGCTPATPPGMRVRYNAPQNLDSVLR